MIRKKKEECQLEADQLVHMSNATTTLRCLPLAYTSNTVGMGEYVTVGVLISMISSPGETMLLGCFGNVEGWARP
jgi:hypothetical protein